MKTKKEWYEIAEEFRKEYPKQFAMFERETYCKGHNDSRREQAKTELGIIGLGVAIAGIYAVGDFIVLKILGK